MKNSTIYSISQWEHRLSSNDMREVRRKKPQQNFSNTWMRWGKFSLFARSSKLRVFYRKIIATNNEIKTRWRSENKKKHWKWGQLSWWLFVTIFLSNFLLLIFSSRVYPTTTTTTFSKLNWSSNIRKIPFPRKKIWIFIELSLVNRSEVIKCRIVSLSTFSNWIWCGWRKWGA